MSLGFYFIIMTSIALAFLCWPLARKKQINKNYLDNDLIIYHDQLIEVDQNLKNALIRSDQANILRNEIQRRILATADVESHQATSYSRRVNIICIIVLIVILPLTAGALYMQLGSPELPDHPTQPITKDMATISPSHQAEMIMTATPEQQQIMITNMVDKLASEMTANPDNIEGWLRLANAYRVLGNLNEAHQAIDQAIKRKPDDIKVLLAAADIQLTGATSDKLPLDFIATMRKILTLDPTNIYGLYYVGEAEHETGHNDITRTMWQKVIDQLPANSADRTTVTDRLKQLEKN